jgi:CRP/FNR family transcriptional regulator
LKGHKLREERSAYREGPEIWAHPPWNVLSQDEIVALGRHSEVQAFERHRIIFRQGERSRGLYCILQGDVLLDHLDEERNHTAFRIAVPGDLLGFRSLFAEQPHAATARALRRCQVNFVPEAPLRRLLESNPRLSGELLKIVAADPGPTYAPLLRSPWLPAASRLAHLLLILHRQCAGNLGEGEVTYELPVSMGSIAALIGIRRETVSRLFQQLQNAGLCTLQGSRIVIPSSKRLIEYSGVVRPRKRESTQ